MATDYAATATCTEATTTAMTTLTILVPSAVGNGEDAAIGSAPLMVSFPGGLPAAIQLYRQEQAVPSNTRAAAASSGDVPTFVWRKVPSAAVSRPKMMLVGQDDACLYASHAVLDPSGTTEIASKSKSSSKSHSSSKAVHPSAASDAIAQPRTKLHVAVFDKVLKTVTIYPTAQDGAILPMQQTVKHYQQSQQQQRSSAAAASAASTSYQSVYEEFGSSKKRKVLKSQEANRVTLDSTVGAGSATVTALLQNAAQRSSSHRESILKQQQEAVMSVDAADPASSSRNNPQPPAFDVATDTWRRQFLPPYDATAENPQDIYDASMVLSREAWNAMGEIVAETIRQAQQTEQQSKQLLLAALIGALRPHRHVTGHYSAADQSGAADDMVPCIKALFARLVEQHFHTKGKTGIESVRPQLQHAMTCAALLSHMIHLYRQLARRPFTAKPPANYRDWLGANMAVAAAVGDKFTTAAVSDRPTSRNQPGVIMSNANRDGCLVHICILYLLAVCSCQPKEVTAATTTSASSKIMTCPDIRPLASDLQVDLKDIQHLLRLAGCNLQRAKQAGGAVAVTLRAPVQFPKPPKRATRSKQRR